MAVVAGFVGAMSGMGGGVVLIPVLTFCGVEIKHVIALSILSKIVVSNSTAASYITRHMPNLKVVVFLEVYAIIGAVVGALITVVIGQRVLFFLCGIAFFTLSGLLWLRWNKRWKPVKEQDAYSHELGWQGSYYDYAESRTVFYQGRRAALAGPLVGGAAVISGLFEIGGSALIVLISDVVIGLPPKVSLTVSSLIIGTMALASADVFLETGLIDPRLVAPTLLGVTLGALAGSKLVTKVTNRTTLRIFLCGLVAVGIDFCLRGIRGF